MSSAISMIYYTFDDYNNEQIKMLQLVALISEYKYTLNGLLMIILILFVNHSLRHKTICQKDDPKRNVYTLTYLQVIDILLMSSIFYVT